MKTLKFFTSSNDFCEVHTVYRFYVLVFSADKIVKSSTFMRMVVVYDFLGYKV
jgi:hypothetical protein